MIFLTEGMQNSKSMHAAPHILRYLVLCAVGALADCSASFAAPDPLPESPFTLTEIRDGIRSRVEQLQGLHVKLSRMSYVIKPAGPPELCWQEENEVDRHAEKTRLLKKVLVPSTGATRWTRIDAWNGRRLTQMGTQIANPAEWNGGVQGSVSNTVWDFWLTALEGQFFDDPRPLVELLDVLDWKVIGEQKISGERAWGIQATVFFPDKEEGPTYQVWISPAKSFAVIEAKQSHKLRGGRERYLQLKDVELQNVEGIWVITSCCIENSSPANGLTRCFYKFTDYQVRLNPPDSLFEVTFPPGTLVWDDIKKIGYVVDRGIYTIDAQGVNHFVPTSDTAAALASAEAMALMTPGPASGNASTLDGKTAKRKRAYQWAISLLVASLAGAAGLLITRRLWRKPSPHVES
jgi:hypothetical protein